jgi:3-oxoadipate enol-lactonase
MSALCIDDIHLFFQTVGDPANPCLVLSNSLGTDLHMWDAQASALSSDFHVVRYDTRGHGQSERGSSPLDIDRLGHDVIALLDHLAIERAHFCGISMGGLTGQWLGIHAPERIDKLVLANTSARIGSAEAWNTRAALVRSDGMDSVADGAAARWFSQAFIERDPKTAARMIEGLRRQSPSGYAACCDALAQADLRGSVATISADTLIIAGRHDPVTTIGDAEWLVAQVSGARMSVVEASHLSNIEASEDFNTILRRFLPG